MFGFHRVDGAEEPAADACFADTPAGIDTGTEHKSQMVGVRLFVDVGGVGKCS